MEDIIEIIGELFLDGLTEIVQNKKISKWIRYPILIFLSSFYLALVVLVTFLAYQEYQEQEHLASLILTIILIILIIMIILFIKKLKDSKK